MPEILVVGAGPVGLTMAAELARHGVSCRIIDRLAEPLPYCRAIGVTPRTLEVWDDMGVARDTIDAGLWLEGRRLIINGQPPRDERLEFSDLPYAELGLPQYETERILSRHLNGFGIAVERGVELAALSQGDDQVAVELRRDEGGIKRAVFRYVIGCDGAHSGELATGARRICSWFALLLFRRRLRNRAGRHRRRDTAFVRRRDRG